MPAPTILVLGGTGTVGSRIVRQLSSQPDHPTVLVASRNGDNSNDNDDGSQKQRDTTNIRHVPFDWHNTDTWSNPFSTAPTTAPTTTTTETPAAETTRNISAVYLVAPPSLNAESLMTEFVEFARARGVRRFVLQSASSIEAGGPAMGKVHAYLRELGQRGEVEWAVLRPSWFQRRFPPSPFLFPPFSYDSLVGAARWRYWIGRLGRDGTERNRVLISSQKTLLASRRSCEASRRRARSTRPRATARSRGCRPTTSPLWPCAR